LREKLRDLGFAPMVFNFDKPGTKDFSETRSTPLLPDGVDVANLLVVEQEIDWATSMLSTVTVGSSSRGCSASRTPFLRRVDHSLTEVSDQTLGGRILINVQDPRVAPEMLEHAVLGAAF
jgi:hypothetical protein